MTVALRWVQPDGEAHGGAAMSLRVCFSHMGASLGDEPLGFRGSLHRNAAAIAHSRIRAAGATSSRRQSSQVRRKPGAGRLARRYDCAQRRGIRQTRSG